MTIVAMANLREGVVFGADSAITFTDKDGDVSCIYDGEQKIYHIGEDKDFYRLPYGIMFWGSAIYNHQSWRNILSNYWRFLSDEISTTANDFVQKFIDYLKIIEPSEVNRPDGGFYIAGFGKEDKEVKCFIGDVKTLTKRDCPQNAFEGKGISFVAQRIAHGIDDITMKAIKDEFDKYTIQTGEPPETKQLGDVIIETIMRKSIKCYGTKDIPLRDGIDWAHFMVWSTIKFMKFKGGHLVCGGDVELAAITLDRGFRRIKRKSLDCQIE